LNPSFAEAQTSLGNVLCDQGKHDEAAAAYRAAIRLKPDYADAHNNLGAALAGQGNLEEAAAEYREAIRLKPDYAKAHVNLGLALQAEGQLDDALASLKKGHELGSSRPGWSIPSARLVRECERLVALERRLPAVLRGEDRPADADEGIGFARLCQLKSKQLFAASARFYDAAFAERPGLAEDLKQGHRYNAACAAARAASGQGKDDPPPDEADRDRWRRKALDWLGADLKLRSGQLDTGTGAARAEVAQKLRHWKGDPDLAGVRDPEELAKLPEAERAEWQALWADVDRLLERAQSRAP
jgi:hypothetical protein